MEMTDGERLARLQAVFDAVALECWTLSSNTPDPHTQRRIAALRRVRDRIEEACTELQPQQAG